MTENFSDVQKSASGFNFFLERVDWDEDPMVFSEFLDKLDTALENAKENGDGFYDDRLHEKVEKTVTDLGQAKQSLSELQNLLHRDAYKKLLDDRAVSYRDEFTD